MTIQSPFKDRIDLSLPLNEYPRMQLRRGSFTNLNGKWEYQITNGEEPSRKEGWKTIIVPFALGSQLSGTKDILQPHQVLWYRRTFPYVAEGVHTLLNFEAVDQCCWVYLNGQFVGEHKGGYAPFSLDVSNAIQNENEILVKVTDDSDQGIYAYGKQKIEHSGMWYTPSSGIWQTVWLEDLPERAVTDLKITPDYNAGLVYLTLAGTYTQVVITVFKNKELVHRGITNQREYTIPLEHFHAWSPEDPFLYDLYIQTEDETVKSYFGMRRFSSARDKNGYMRFMLNEKPVFLTGLLDQGYNPDGLLTYPSEEAMLFDLQKVKELGYNMIRKHIKVECRRWYYLCDLLGILVMQDMPSGGNDYSFLKTAVLPNLGMRRMKDHDAGKFGRSNEASKQAYYMELDEMLDNLYNCTSIFAWVPFNEGWGQFDSDKVTGHIRQYDSTRLIDSASGWHDQGAGNFNSRHVYFHSFHVPKNDGRILLLSEFGGYAYLELGHSSPQKLYGYKKFKEKRKYNDALIDLYELEILDSIPRGLSGCVYTQLADVEDECNGILSEDRRIVKVDERRLRKINERCKRSLK